MDEGDIDNETEGAAASSVCFLVSVLFMFPAASAAVALK